MYKKSTLTAQQRVALVLRLLSKEEPAVQLARRAEVSEQTFWMNGYTSTNAAITTRGHKQSLPATPPLGYSWIWPCCRRPRPG